MARRNKHQLGRALLISAGLHLAVLSLQFGLSGNNWPALGWNWGEREASVPLPSRRVELRAGPVETAVTPSSPLPVHLPVARTTATPFMPKTLIVTLLPPPQTVPAAPAVPAAPTPVPVSVLPRPTPQVIASTPVARKKIHGKKGSPILSVTRAASDETWRVPPMATGDQTGKKDRKEPAPPPALPLESLHASQEEPTPAHVVAIPMAETEAPAKARDAEQEQQTLRARERAEEAQRQLAERAEAERIAARALQRQKDEAEARAKAQADEVRRKAEQEAMAKKSAEEAAKAEAAAQALRQRAEAQAQAARERELEKARQEQEQLRLAAAQARAEEEKRQMELERLAEEQRREAQKLAEKRKAEAQARAEAQAQAQAAAAAREAREARYQQEQQAQQAQQALAAERARTVAAAAAAAAAANHAPASTAPPAGGHEFSPPARKGGSLATQALNMARRGDDPLPSRTPVEKESPLRAERTERPERPARSSFLGRNPNEIQLSFYGDSWEEKIRRIGHINYPRVPRDSVYGSIIVSVRIRSDGSLESVSLLKSSGNRELDQAARRIIEMCAPFAAFPPDLRRNFDVVELRRTLTFPDRPPLLINQ